MPKIFNNTARYIGQEIEDIGHGMILPLDQAQRKKELAMLTKSMALILVGLGTDINIGSYPISNIILNAGFCYLGLLLGEYKNTGETIRKALDKPQP